MKLKFYSICCFLAASTMVLTSCVQNKDAETEKPATTENLIAKAVEEKPTEQIQLPVRFNKPEYLTINDRIDDSLDSNLEAVIKVGANIRSTRGPQPLWDILKRLASLKGMNVSWSSDVDQSLLVDVDISANDNFYEAIDNLLRQVDYYHEVQGSTIIIKYKETKTYHVAMPFTKQLYETATGGNVLGSGDETSSVEGTIRLDSKGNEFDIWKNIQQNLDAIIATWSTTTTTPLVTESDDKTNKKGPGEKKADEDVESPTRQTSTGGNSYTIDKPVGLITVNAPRPLQLRIADYLNNIKKELYKQVTIEAKIIEVQLADNSTLGIDWNLLLSSLSFGATLGLNKDYGSRRNTDKSIKNTTRDAFGREVNVLNNRSDIDYTGENKDGIEYSWKRGDVSIDGAPDGEITSTNQVSDYLSSSKRNQENALDTVATAATILTNGASNALAGTVSLATFNFADFLHALSQQGTTTILSNPKLSVMNGQPALITVGRNVTYVDSVEATVDGTGADSKTTYTVNTERILSGVGLTLTPVIRDDNEIIMNLVPVTSVLEEPIVYRQVGLGEVGLPIINLREMSSMVQVKDGEMLVIGGLISTVESTEGENLFPGLADVPVLKYLTGYETKKMIKRELIILLRPRIL